jgi:hypothetical protein
MSRAPSSAQSDHLPRLRHRLRTGLARLRDEGWSILQTAIAAGHETARFAPPRRRALRHLELYAAAASRAFEEAVSRASEAG